MEMTSWRFDIHCKYTSKQSYACYSLNSWSSEWRKRTVFTILHFGWAVPPDYIQLIVCSFSYEVKSHFSVAFKDLDKRYVESSLADSEGWYISKLKSAANSHEDEFNTKIDCSYCEYRVVYTLFYRISRNNDACANSVYPALFFLTEVSLGMRLLMML